MSLVIEDDLAKSVFGMADAIAAVRNAYAAFSRGEILESSRVNVLYPKAFLRLMAAAWPSRKLAGYKVLHRANGRAGATYHLYEMETASLVAMIDAGHLTAVRTGACGGLAADLMSAPDAEVLGVIGTGNEARAQVEAICAVRPIRRLQAFGRDPQRRETFCREMADRFGLEAVAAPDGPSALNGAQIIAVATNTGAGGPAFFGDWIADHPVHINSIGSTLPIQRELDERVWSRADRIVIDAKLALEESGDAIEARKHGTLDESKVALLGDVVNGASSGRQNAQQRTLYKSVGSALQDLASAAAIYDSIIKSGVDCPTIPFVQKMGIVQD